MYSAVAWHGGNMLKKIGSDFDVEGIKNSVKELSEYGIPQLFLLSVIALLICAYNIIRFMPPIQATGTAIWMFVLLVASNNFVLAIQHRKRMKKAKEDEALYQRNKILNQFKAEEERRLEDAIRRK